MFSGLKGGKLLGVLGASSGSSGGSGFSVILMLLGF